MPQCLRYREGSPLYVTHFLYHVTCCISSSCFFCLAQTAAHSSSACHPLRAGNAALIQVFISSLLLRVVLILTLLLSLGGEGDVVCFLSHEKQKVKLLCVSVKEEVKPCSQEVVDWTSHF